LCQCILRPPPAFDHLRVLDDHDLSPRFDGFQGTDYLPAGDIVRKRQHSHRIQIVSGGSGTASRIATCL
jgi:hypothetical protein